MSSRRRKRKINRCVLWISVAAIFIIIICLCIPFFLPKKKMRSVETLPHITIKEKLLQKNEYSRPGIELEEVEGIVVHYTANPGSDAMDNRNYFNNLPKINLGKTTKTYASSHFIVGLEGQIIQCIPLNEMAYASNDRNDDTIAIECCHPKKNGKFNKVTRESLVELLAYLCLRFDLEEEDIIRHYDVTGKMCPLYYVENEDLWEELKKDVIAKKAVWE